MSGDRAVKPNGHTQTTSEARKVSARCRVRPVPSRARGLRQENPSVQPNLGQVHQQEQAAGQQNRVQAQLAKKYEGAA